MKRKLLFSFFCALAGFTSAHSQSNTEKIQKYFEQNAKNLQLTNQEVNDWILENTTSSETTGIENCYVKQSHQGIEIQQSYLYFWVKRGEIINTPEGFITGIGSKINTTQPTISITEGFSRALTLLGETSFPSSILQKEANKYKLSNGNLTEDPVAAKLIYFLTPENTLRLAWSYEFYTQNTNHLWNVQIDAENGKVLEKRDLVVRCSTLGHDHSKHKHQAGADSSFLNKFFKQDNASALLTPGTTNYRVIPWNYESPNHSARQLITNPEATTILTPSTTSASPNGWHNTSTTVGGTTAAALFNYTRGNNVWSGSDFLDANSSTPTTYATASSGAYPSLTFDFPYNGNGTSPKTYVNAAITNLFYMNNIMHDLWYQYGFTEGNRNFQTVNYGRGGTGNDYVVAEAQDKSFLATPVYNNANFATPAEGSRPRMQMYLWNSGKKFSNLTVTSGTLNGTSYQIIENAFNEGHTHLPIAPATLSNSLVLYDDGTPDNSDACTAAVNAAALNGKIAVIRRGTCTFAIKAKAAQTAGAVAVLIVNNAAGTISMAGDDPTITIPALSMTQADGEALITAMSSGTVNVNLSSPDNYAYADGDFDNGIIAHEYGHGISTRLVGGGAGLSGSAEQPGEGWSDWFWLMMQIKPGDTKTDARGIATFAINEPVTGEGIREFRYSTDMAVNPHTYADTNDQWFTDPADGFDKVNVHGVGSIWCAMLWDLAWNYIDKYGYSSNIYNGTAGNNKVMRLVIDALKLTPANPSFIQCRDAIIQADQNTTGGQDFCMIWATFAKRGLGTGASAGTNTSSAAAIQDQTESFAVPAPGPNCTLAVNDFEAKNSISIYPNPSNGLINIKINTFSGVANLQVVDLNGRVVFSKNNVDFSTEKTFNLSNLQSGVYVIKLNGDALNHTQKIILD